MHDSLDELRNAKLNAPVSRRYVLNGILGVSAVAAFGPLLAACAKSDSSTEAATGGKLGGELNFIGYSGEDAATVVRHAIDQQRSAKHLMQCWLPHS